MHRTPRDSGVPANSDAGWSEFHSRADDESEGGSARGSRQSGGGGKRRGIAPPNNNVLAHAEHRPGVRRTGGTGGRQSGGGGPILEDAPVDTSSHGSAREVGSARRQGSGRSSSGADADGTPAVVIKAGRRATPTRALASREVDDAVDYLSQFDDRTKHGKGTVESGRVAKERSGKPPPVLPNQKGKVAAKAKAPAATSPTDDSGKPMKKSSSNWSFFNRGSSKQRNSDAPFPDADDDADAVVAMPPRKADRSSRKSGQGVMSTSDMDARPLPKPRAAAPDAPSQVGLIRMGGGGPVGLDMKAFLSDTTGNVMAGGGGIGGPSRQQRLRSADDIAVDVERDSSTFRQVLKARLQQMRIISAHWMQGDFPRAIEYAVTLNDNAIMIDMLSILMGRTSVVTIEMCFDVLPIAKDICLSQFEDHVLTAVKCIGGLFKKFAPLMRQELSADMVALPGAVDINREERVEKLGMLLDAFISTVPNLEALASQTGRCGYVCQRLSADINALAAGESPEFYDGPSGMSARHA